MVGYGKKKLRVRWPNNARVALQIVLNYEEGAENCVLHGDKHSEVFLSEIIGAQPIKGRHMNMESFYEYGSRRGFWRLHEIFQKKKIPITIFGVGMALERNKDICSAIKNAGYEVASHGWRWIDYQNVSKPKEKKLSREEIQGLYAELKFIEDSLQYFSPYEILDSWRGPDHGLHDFVFRSISFEIKSTLNQSIRITSEDQLDDLDLEKLFLNVRKLSMSDKGESLNDIYEKLIKLFKNVADLELFKAKLRNSGFFEDSDFSSTKFIYCGCKRQRSETTK